MKRTLLFLFLLCLMAAPVAGQDRSVRIGVLANRGVAQCLQEWNATAQYLNAMVRGHSFVIVPLAFDQVDPAVADQAVEFIVVNSSIYVELEFRHRINRIATMRVLRLGQGYTQFGGVIFHRKDRTDIRSLEDLRGKRFMAVDDTSLGGWRATWGRLKTVGIDPFKDFRLMTFGGTHDAVVYSVRDGAVDAGTVRTDTMERMQAEHKINSADFAVLPYHGDGPDYAAFPFALSTPLYPEWPFAKVSHTPDDLARKVASALLAMPEDSPAALRAHISGWTVPLNYQPVEDLLKFLKIGPYQGLGEVTLADFWDQYRGLVLGLAGVLAVMGLALGVVSRLNRSLGRARAALEQELTAKGELVGQLSLAHAEMALIFNTSAGGMRVLGLDGTILRVNNAFTRISGWTREEAVGRHCCEVFAGAACHGLDCTLEQVRGRRDTLEIETIKVRKDGVAISCAMTASPLLDAEGQLTAVIQEFRDVTERRKFQAALEGQNLFLTTIIEALPEPFFYMDTQGRYQMVNKAFTALVGQEPKDILGKTAFDLESPQRAQVHAFLDRLIMDQADTGVRVFESTFQDASGRQRTVLLHKARVTDAKGRLAGVLGLIVDITERKRMEALREDVERLTRHDLKTPLGAVITLPELLLAEAGFTPEQREYLTLIRESGLRMLNLINISLDLFKMEQGMYRLIPTEVELVKLIRGILGELRPHSQGKMLAMDILVQGRPVTDDQAFLAQGEELLLYCLLANLLKNAMEAAPHRSTVTISLVQGQGVTIEVHNLGVVSERIRDTFFDKYTTEGKIGGTGLGTYSVRLIAEVHGGSVAMRTLELEGTTVSVHLPDLRPGQGRLEQGKA